MANVVEGQLKEICLKKETLNLIDNLTYEGELEIEVSEILIKVVQMFGKDNKLYIGDGICLKICDELTE